MPPVRHLPRHRDHLQIVLPQKTFPHNIACKALIALFDRWLCNALPGLSETFGQFPIFGISCCYIKDERKNYMLQKSSNFINFLKIPPCNKLQLKTILYPWVSLIMAP